MDRCAAPIEMFQLGFSRRFEEGSTWRFLNYKKIDFPIYEYIRVQEFSVKLLPIVLASSKETAKDPVNVQ